MKKDTYKHLLLFVGCLFFSLNLLANKEVSDQLGDLELEAEVEQMDIIDTEAGVREAKEATQEKIKETENLRTTITQLERDSKNLQKKQEKLIKRFNDAVVFSKTAEEKAEKAEKKKKEEVYKVEKLTAQVKKFEQRAVDYKKANKLSLKEIRKADRQNRLLTKRKKIALKMIEKYKKALQKNKSLLRKANRQNSKLKKMVAQSETQVLRLRQKLRGRR